VTVAAFKALVEEGAAEAFGGGGDPLPRSLSRQPSEQADLDLDITKKRVRIRL
jgi:hypothetical protein